MAAMGPADRPPDAREEGVQPAARTAWRLTFRYEGDRVELVSRDRIATVEVPPDAPPPPEAARVGAWVELRDADDRVIHEHPLAQAIQRDVEVFSPEPGAPIRRVRLPEPRGAFQVIVPALPAARDLVLHDARRAGAAPPGAARAPKGAKGARRDATATELARVRLDAGGDDGGRDR